MQPQNFSPNRHHNSHLVSSLLAAACTAAALFLSGCDSGVAAANKDATEASAKAQEMTKTAGYYHATQSFIDKLDDKDESARNDDVKAAKSAMDKNPDAWKSYLEQKPIAEDLKAAAAVLTSALANADFNNTNYKSVLQAQLGSISTQQSQLELEVANDKLIDLVEAATNFQLAADSVATLGSQADALDARAKASRAIEFPNLQPAVDDAKAAVQKAQAAVSDIEKQISDQQAKATAIYSQTEAAFQAAEGLKGQDALDAAKKAGEARKEADIASAEIIKLQPTLSQAQQELAAAQIAQSKAEAQVQSVTLAGKQAEADASTATNQAGILRQAAKKMLDGDADMEGLAKKYDAFLKLGTDLDAKIAAARTSATSADKALGDASSAWTAYQSEIDAKGLSTSDPLYIAVSSKEPGALIKLSQATAKIQLARVNLIAYNSAAMQGGAATAMATIDKAAGEAPVALPNPAKATELQSQATDQFKAANAMAQTAISTPTAPSKWLSLTLQSVALHGVYAATGLTPDREAAEAAAKAAKALNPNLNIPGLMATANP